MKTPETTMEEGDATLAHFQNREVVTVEAEGGRWRVRQGAWSCLCDHRKAALLVAKLKAGWIVFEQLRCAACRGTGLNPESVQYAPCEACGGRGGAA